MKKSILALTMVVSLGLGLTAVSAYAWYGGGPGGGDGPRPGYGVNVDDAAYKKFMDDTAQLRRELAVDRAEMNALMAGENPDPAKVRELAGRLTDNREKLAETARAANIDAPYGYGYGPNPNCRGYGYGRGFGPNDKRSGYGRGYGNRW